MTHPNDVIRREARVEVDVQGVTRCYNGAGEQTAGPEVWDNVVPIRARNAGPLALPPNLSDADVDESDELERLELERDVRLYRSRRRRRQAIKDERRRDRIAGAIVLGLFALCVYLGAGGAAWPH